MLPKIVAISTILLSPLLASGAEKKTPISEGKDHRATDLTWSRVDFERWRAEIVEQALSFQQSALQVLQDEEPKAANRFYKEAPRILISFEPMRPLWAPFTEQAE